ncbi:MAG: D-cysteine desulfhydrase [Nitrospinota bacterium]|nr:MAG: D-cysteine desulfhydrase [Nitrospinota bacterium]
MFLGKFPRVRLAHLPTPLEEMQVLTRTLGGPRLFIKRDDCTGLAFGGNKTRKLEFLLGHAQKQGADTLITEGGVQSNHCRQTVAAAIRCGMECVLVLDQGERREVTGNLLLDQILGARIVLVEKREERQPTMERIAAELRSQGKHPYIIPTGGSNGIGAVGYASVVHELEMQANELGIPIDAIVAASGSGGTQGGLVLGAKLLHSQAQIIGISDGAPRERLVEDVLRVAREGAAYLQVPLTFTPEEIMVYDEYAREGYGVPNPGMIEAVRLLARTEGILLDPVYSGKAMAGLIDLVRQGVFRKDQVIVFIHTGGTPALFAYREVFQE